MNNIWAIADLHLAFGVPEKTMEIFGPQWVGYAAKIEKHWNEKVGAEDLVLIPGDISWAMSLEEAQVDLEWIDALPGTKVMIKGNHDYWWSSLTKVNKILPPSLHVIQNNAFHAHGIAIAGTRLWDSSEYNFDAYINAEVPVQPGDLLEGERIFTRELGRLEMSLKAMDQKANVRIAMTHYPPIGADLKPSKVSVLLEKYGVQHCIFGHLHNVRPGSLSFGKQGNVMYHLTSCDYLNFSPLFILQQNGSFDRESQ